MGDIANRPGATSADHGAPGAHLPGRRFHMMAPVTRHPLVLLAFSLAVLGACRSIPFPEFTPIDANLNRSEFVRPAEAATTEHRWIIEAGGMEGVFTLYLRLRPPSTMEMVALSDMGGTMCSARLEKGTVEVQRASPLLSEDFARRLLLDLRPFFLPAPANAYAVVELRDGTRALHRSEGDTEELRLKGGEVRVGNRGRQTAVITVERWKDGRPETYRIEATRYNATADIVRWERLP